MSVYLSDPALSSLWLVSYWPTVPLCLSALYLLLVYLLEWWMRKRDPIKPKTLLIVWNTSLAVFSVVGFAQFAPSGLLNELAKGGFIHSVCLINQFSTPTVSLWMSLFILSKFVEFGDTFFLILRKAPLTFLHVYHHVSVALYSWFGGTTRSSLGHWFMSMNFAVHSVMYTYFTMKVFGINVPSVVAKTITSLQLAQFFVGLVCVLVAAVRLWRGEVCNSTKECILLGLIIYGSYLVLFMNFFYHRYIKPKAKKKDN